MSHDDYAIEPVRGLPEKLPPDEHILWQGAPDWRRLARDAFHIRTVGVYFLALMLWRAGVNWTEHRNIVFGIGAALSLLPVALIGLGLLAALAYCSARTSVYTLTNRRLVMRIGMALPTSINIPFRVIEGADLDAHSDHSGAIAIRIAGSDRMAWSNLWPHVRPWRITRPQPMLRALPDARHVAGLLRDAVADAHPPIYTGSVSVAQSAMDQNECCAAA